MFMWRLLCVVAIAVLPGVAAFAGVPNPQAASAYSALSLSPPTPASLTVCHGFGCRDHTEIALSAADRARLTQILRAGRSSAEAERRAIAAAVQWFDRRVGPEAGTTHHIARAGHDQLGEADSNFDCIDASRNTTSLLLVLDEMRLLKYHSVEETVARGAFIDGRWPHATAVVAELSSRKQWAVDSWTHAYGEKPDVKPLQIWLSEGGL
jgi:hypothetical protein